MDSRGLCVWPVIDCFSNCFTKKLDRKLDSQDSNQHSDVGRLHPNWCFNLLQHIGDSYLMGFLSKSMKSEVQDYLLRLITVKNYHPFSDVSLVENGKVSLLNHFLFC